MIKFFSFIFLISATSLADFNQERKLILQMQGCYEVQFQFVETFPRTEGYQVKDSYFSKALEWVEVDREDEEKIELQHLLLVGPGQVLKHWRQEWTYQAEERLRFVGDQKWLKESYESSSIQGRWEQKVTQVDDSPRYECSAPWARNNKGLFWECASWNPLPRREFSKRSDYNVINRRNRHQITSYGWVHEQDNEKLVVRSEQVEKILTEEKGKNIYKKVATDRCQVARDWWKDYRDIWSQIRLAWDEVEMQQSTLEFKKSPKPLWQSLFALSERARNENWSDLKIKRESKSAIEDHLVNTL